MMNARLFGFWNSLTEALRSGSPQNEIKAGDDLFEMIYSEPTRLRGFLKAMSGISAGPAGVISAAFPRERHETVIDIGCAEGLAPVQIAQAHAHLSGGGFDLPPVGPFFDEYVAAAGLAERLQFHPGDFFADELPSADVLIMGHILHDWGLDEKRMLLEKAHRALPEDGALIVYETMIDARTHSDC